MKTAAVKSPMRISAEVIEEETKSNVTEPKQAEVQRNPKRLSKLQSENYSIKPISLLDEEEIKLPMKLGSMNVFP